MKTSGHKSLEKYTSLFIERVVCEREWETEQNCNILTSTPMAITAFLSRYPGLLNRGPGGPASLGHGPHFSIFSPTNPRLWIPTAQLGVLRAPLFWWLILSTASYLQLTKTSIAPSYCFTPTQYNLSIVNVIPLIPSTGCTCYLHRCISCSDSSAGVNIQHLDESSIKYLLMAEGEKVVRLRLIRSAFLQIMGFNGRVRGPNLKFIISVWMQQDKDEYI